MTRPPALLIAAHGTRLPPGQDAARALTARVSALLPGVDVRDGFVELTEPPLGAALSGLADQDRPIVMVPLMLGAGGHVRDDIPEAIEAVGDRVRVIRGQHLGPDPRLRAAVRERIAAVLGDWTPDEVAVVFLGRGCSVADANADHTRLGRMLWEEGGYAFVIDAFIQVTHPTVPEGLSLAYSTGARRIVVSPHYLFPGLLENWAHEAVERWRATHPDAEVRIAPVIGDCDALARVVIDRYREAAAPTSAGR
ncbi:MAG: sirohydrochlorin chelatase [Nigerium sp.]|nr:sirohydrochlorin chelatase [Nigerium sp.]